MRVRSAIGRGSGLAVLVALGALGCDDPVDEGPGGPIVPPLPFATIEIALRPLAIEVPPTSGRPTPSLAVYNLTAFTRGGTTISSFDWTVPAAIGTVVPKTPQLTINDAAVYLQPRADGSPPLGFFDVTAAGRNGTETSNLTSRFAVVRNTWMKHERPGWTEPEPLDPVSSPVFIVNTTTDSIYFASHQSAQNTRIRRIPAFASLAGPEPDPADVLLLPTLPEGNNFATAAQLSPDFAPAGFDRREMLFASEMDSQYPRRCPVPMGCTNAVPINLWVVRVPGGLTVFQPRQVTWDSTFVEGGRTRWYAFNYEHPRWDPTATGSTARIAFISNRAGTRDLWTAILRDANADGLSDTLDTFQRLTTGTAVAGFGWHPDGTRLCVARGSRLEWVDAASGAVTAIAVPDSNLVRFLSPSVYVGTGQPTPLIAFQAQAENLVNLFVLDEAEGRLARLLAYPAPVTHNLFPRWHPRRKAIVYVSDYTVAHWANTSPPNLAVPDVPSLTVPELAGMPRSKFPSPWVVELE